MEVPLPSTGTPSNKEIPSALVVGGLGFLGSRLVMQLLETGSTVQVVDSRISDGGANWANSRNWPEEITRSIRSSVEELPSSVTPDFVFNLAGRTSHKGSMDYPINDAESNVSDQLRILEWIRRRRPDSHVIFTSTRQVYGSPVYLPVDERHPIHPPDVNAVNKYAAEQHHLLYRRVYGLNCTILRLTNCFGPGMRIKDSRQGFVGEWIRRSLTGEPLRLFGGSQVRDFLYGDDAAKAIIQAAQSTGLGSGTYNVGGVESLSLNEMADIIAKLVPGVAVQVEKMPRDLAAIEVGETRLNDSQFRGATGWAPETSIYDGLSRTLSYYQRHLKEYL